MKSIGALTVTVTWSLELHVSDSMIRVSLSVGRTCVKREAVDGELELCLL